MMSGDLSKPRGDRVDPALLGEELHHVPERVLVQVAG